VKDRAGRGKATKGYSEYRWNTEVLVNMHSYRN
jgi:hypothetical protein